MQSERFYAALKVLSCSTRQPNCCCRRAKADCALQGHGAPCKLVLLPFESHSYRARESVLHSAFEMDEWMQKYCSPGDSQVQQAQQTAQEAVPPAVPAGV